MVDEPLTVDAALRKIACESARRITDADAKANEATSAFAAGEFDEYYQREYGADDDKPDESSESDTT